MAEIKCMPLKLTTDGPLFGRTEGTLGAGGTSSIYALQNMMLRPGGYAEARGGFEELKPSGGTAADAISAGGYSDALQHSTSYGWIRTYEALAGAGSQYSENKQFYGPGWVAFVGNDVDDAIYFGADAPFSRIGVSLSFAGSATPTIVYEYWNGTNFDTDLTTAETIDWTVLRTPQYASWTMPTDWATTTRGDSGTGNVLKYWMRIRITVGAFVAQPAIGRVEGFWTGMRELYVATQSPRTSATAGTFKRHGQTGTTEEWFSVNASLFSGNASPARMAAYRGRVVLVNGKDTKRWDGALFSDLGIPPYVLATNAITLTAVAAGTLGAGVWRYYAAWGQGPCQNTDTYADRQDVGALYGPGRATYAGEVTTAAAQRVQIELGGGGLPSGISSIYIYRTQDLTNVPTGERANFPAFLIQSWRALNNTGAFENNFGTGGVFYYDDNTAYSFPNQEAVTFDNTPPKRCKYLAVYQNRLFLADNDTIYWSDPFVIDTFSTKSTTGYIRLARALGGRHTGIVEFADQIVAFTEDQTWGITNVDLDVPQLYPIHPGVGCIAPDSIAVGDGVLIWAARDGFYAWTGGSNAPEKISGEWDVAFANMNFESHGGTKGVIHNRMYDVRRGAPDYTNAGAVYRFEMDTQTWSVLIDGGPFSSVLWPLASIHAPLGNNDAGVLHPLWGKADYLTSGGEYTLFLGELTTQDNGSGYTCYGTMYFPQKPGEMFSPWRLTCYYQAADGWGTPSLSFIPANIIGTSPGTIGTNTADTGTDYSLVTGHFASVPRGTSDLKCQFSVASSAGGTVQGQRLFGGILEGKPSKIRRGA